MKDPNQGSPFSEGRGRGFDIPEQKTPKMNGRGNADGEKLIIDLNDLNKPGVGPVDFDELKRGRIMPRVTTDQLGKTTGDID